MGVCEVGLCGLGLDRWRVVFNTVMKLPISIKGENVGVDEGLL
jgi:hypothetical protein